MRIEYVHEKQDGCIDLCQNCWKERNIFIQDFLFTEEVFYIESPTPEYVLIEKYECLKCHKSLTKNDIEWNFCPMGVKE